MSERFTVTAPVASFNGDVADLVFRDGKATADSVTDARALAYCRRHGYRVEPVEGSPDVDRDTRPKTTDNKPDWVAYALTQGAVEDEAEAMTKAELVAKYGTKGSSDE
jgi:hypothetical protein